MNFKERLLTVLAGALGLALVIGIIILPIWLLSLGSWGQYVVLGLLALFFAWAVFFIGAWFVCGVWWLFTGKDIVPDWLRRMI